MMNILHDRHFSGNHNQPRSQPFLSHFEACKRGWITTRQLLVDGSEVSKEANASWVGKGNAKFGIKRVDKG